MVDKKDAKNVKEEVKKFNKKQFLSSKKYGNRKDVINVVIKDNEEVTTAELEKRISSFLKGKVK